MLHIFFCQCTVFPFRFNYALSSLKSRSSQSSQSSIHGAWPTAGFTVPDLGFVSLGTTYCDNWFKGMPCRAHFEHTVPPPPGPIADVAANSATPTLLSVNVDEQPTDQPPFLKCRSRSCHRSSRRPFTTSASAHHNSPF